MTDLIGLLTAAILTLFGPTLTPLETHHGGTWTQPGTDPYRGDSYSALRFLGLNREDAEVISTRIAKHDSDGTIIFAKDSVTDLDHRYTYSPVFDMTFGMSVHYAMTSNVPTPQIADRYIHHDYIIAVPRICGNITLLYANTVRPGAAGSIVDIPADSSHARAQGTVPEPSTILLFGAGLALLIKRKRT